ncbi:ribonuclease R [Kosmotoga arenicorallina S304]|uniref:Ribonuclease R n=1 Tax=Kosmotoga arenicorallina S304 TaxID=1453497 RepID=A0A176JZX9_9BACT|nr:ribonuclease R [Kosmotoga arenicorallina]OAA29717.1 ribonuclease R [Kosmotoga arenicorallina S304]
MRLTIEELLKKIYSSKYTPSTLTELARKMNIHDKTKRRILRSLLKELVESGKIIKDSRGRYVVPGENITTGYIKFSRKGLGAMVSTEDGEQIYIGAEDTGFALDGDKVLVEKGGRFRDIARGKVIKILKRKREKIVGTFITKGLFAFVIPDDIRIKYDFYIPPENYNNAKPDEKVVIRITRYPTRGKNPEGIVEKVLGTVEDPAVDLPSIVFKHELPEPGWFPEDVLKEAKRVSHEPDSAEKNKRKDFAKEPIFTIDGEDAKDFDDAIGIKKLPNGNFLLGVHIADVSHYVKEGSRLDHEAYERGTSVYLLDTVIPMLPFQLSNNICSLREGVDRLTLSLEMEISPTGKLVDYKISEGFIRSARRLTYNEVNRFLRGDKDPELHEKLNPVKEELLAARELAAILRDWRKKRGSVMDISSREVKILTNKKGNVIDIIPQERGESEVMIEEFMIKANETVAEIFANQGLPFVYRIHEEPDSDALFQLKNYLEAIGLNIKMPRNIHPKVLQQILEKTKEHPLHSSIERVVVRSMKRAIYSEQNVGHFGLASEAYTHFTSPIRRYPDLVVHRLLKKLIRKNMFSQKEIEKYEEILPKIADHCSKRERIANEAEWDLLDMKKVEYMGYHIGEHFNAVITGVTKFGLFVEIPEKMISGLVHISTLDDYYEFDEKANILIGKRRKGIFRIGDELVVQAVRADKTTMEIDFIIVEDEKKSNSKSRKKSSKRKKRAR